MLDRLAGRACPHSVRMAGEAPTPPAPGLGPCRGVMTPSWLGPRLAGISKSFTHIAPLLVVFGLTVVGFIVFVIRRIWIDDQSDGPMPADVGMLLQLVLD